MSRSPSPPPDGQRVVSLLWGESCCYWGESRVAIVVAQVEAAAALQVANAQHEVALLRQELLLAKAAEVKLQAEAAELTRQLARTQGVVPSGEPAMLLDEPAPDSSEQMLLEENGARLGASNTVGRRTAQKVRAVCPRPCYYPSRDCIPVFILSPCLYCTRFRRNRPSR